jgi:D-3-phosphoglycerate dehydrogenase
VSDFPTPAVVGVKGAIIIPHLGASTEESEDNCAKMAVKQLRDYLENGNIKNSVNYPNCDMGRRGNNTRIVLLHHNIPNMIGQFTRILAADNMNIAGALALGLCDDLPEGQILAHDGLSPFLVIFYRSVELTVR